MSTTTTGFKVIQPGILTLIQDAGRFGQHGIGLTTGGPLDPQAFNWANRLCGNDLSVSALEVSIGGLVLEAQIETRLCVTGAAMPLKINGEERELWRAHPIMAGDRIELGFASDGARAYLAVAGGFDIAPSFGSSATVTREGIGGLNGTKLQAGELLPANPAERDGCLVLPESYRPEYGKHANLRVIPGYQQQAFSRLQQRIFFSNDYKVSDRCDRMGFRLEGPEIKPSIDGILSEGICLGAIQVPADGQPIVLLNDRQTIGGYPKIGSVLSLDTGALAQLMPGSTVSFEPITMEDAHNIHCLAASYFERVEPQPCDPR
ncbi:biotin-dependent carboxyltransferase family protein [Motiliproteus sp.]|uniref:5-oxoprolinase subunit C family protein n=1 Tax=Motiliproteus sp. TaxID=1898955 RepID=UPI003BAC17F0